MILVIWSSKPGQGYTIRKFISLVEQSTMQTQLLFLVRSLCLFSLLHHWPALLKLLNLRLVPASTLVSKDIRWGTLLSEAEAFGSPKDKAKKNSAVFGNSLNILAKKILLSSGTKVQDLSLIHISE